MDANRLDSNGILFILEMANNHDGSLEHGERIILEMYKVTRNYPQFRFAIKFQYRELGELVHPDYLGSDLKSVKRFRDTALSDEDRIELMAFARHNGFLVICTPFDEPSVAKVAEHGYDFIKVGSPSFTDWPLWEAIVRTDLPIIASTGGASLQDIQRVVMFLEHRNKSLALLHCVGEYPTPNDHLNIGQISYLRSMFNVPIGYSTHENPNDLASISIALAMGATIFERHVGVEYDTHKLNAYSSNPAQINAWLSATVSSLEAIGCTGARAVGSPKEKADLHGFSRGVFARTRINPGDTLTSTNTFLAIPTVKDQLTARYMGKYMNHIVYEPVGQNEPIMSANVHTEDLRTRITQYTEEVGRILKRAGVRLPSKVPMELSHHYGLDRFNEYGATIINCINREYCKKLIVLLPGQKHPVHHHIRKDESFHVLYGDVTFNLNGNYYPNSNGEIVTIPRESWHGFSSHRGAVIEEISTTSYTNDSVYSDPHINSNTCRKTPMTFWADWLEGNP